MDEKFRKPMPIQNLEVFIAGIDCHIAPVETAASLEARFAQLHQELVLVIC
jgi:hypothetical protein